MATDGEEMLLIDGLDDQDGATAWTIPPDGEAVRHPLLDSPLALPFAYWDGTDYVIGGLPCPGWHGQPGTDTEFISSYCGTTKFNLFRIDRSHESLEKLGEVDGGPTGTLTVAAVDDGVALLRTGYTNDFVRMTSNPETPPARRFSSARLSDPDLAGVCPAGRGTFVAFAMPGVSFAFPAHPTAAALTQRYILPSKSSAWTEADGNPGTFGGLHDVVFGGCDGDDVVFTEHASATEVQHFALSASNTDAEAVKLHLGGLAPASNLGMVGPSMITTTNQPESTSYRVGLIRNRRTRVLAELDGLPEAPHLLGVTDQVVAYTTSATGGPATVILVEL